MKPGDKAQAGGGFLVHVVHRVLRGPDPSGWYEVVLECDHARTRLTRPLPTSARTPCPQCRDVVWRQR